ncbi:hypothetical protein BRN46_13630 [Xanthomonas oryzae pv. oryzae]|nr:hypothetical protein BRN46_13630 [Xanthomonas oryzae pv. oryzae]
MKVTDVKLLPPAHGTPSGRVAPDRMQVVAIENYFYCVTKSESVGTVRPRNTGSVGGFWR